MVNVTTVSLVGFLLSAAISLLVTYWVIRLAIRHSLEEHEERRDERERRREEQRRVQEQRARIRAMEED